MRRHSLAAVVVATAACEGSADGDEVSAYKPVCDGLLVSTGGVGNVREMAELVTDGFGEMLSVMHGRTVDAKMKLRDRAFEADWGTK